jgi:putative membrane protein
MRPPRGRAARTVGGVRAPHCDNPVTVEHPRIHWLADPAVLAPIVLLVVVYVRRLLQVRREDGPRGATALHALAFAGAILALLAALVSPIDALGEEYLFSAHMLQHVLLGDIAPLLLLLSLSRVMLRPVTRRLMGIERALGPLASPVTAIVVWLGTMYLWHIPALYDAALEHPLVHVLEHFSFFAAGLALWWPLIQPIPMRRSLTGLQPLAYIAVAKGSLAALGLVLAWSSTAFYPFYESVPRIWDLTAVEDQNVAGVIMMVEQSMTLVLVLVWVFVRMLTRSEEDELRRERLEEAASPRDAVAAPAHGAVDR